MSAFLFPEILHGRMHSSTGSILADIPYMWVHSGCRRNRFGKSATYWWNRQTFKTFQVKNWNKRFIVKEVSRSYLFSLLTTIAAAREALMHCICVNCISLIKALHSWENMQKYAAIASIRNIFLVSKYVLHIAYLASELMNTIIKYYEEYKWIINK